jgi:hypothetical protein
MGKRTIRIPRSKIPMQTATLPGKTVHVVMLDGKTHAGRILSADANQIVVEDGNAAWTHKGRHQQTLSVAEVYYIVYDVISAW